MLLPMSPTDSMFLLGESREHPMHVGALALFTPPEGMSVTQVRGMFDGALARGAVAPLLRQRARRAVTTLGQWGWETLEPADVDLEHHVRVDALPQPGGTDQLMALVSRLHAGLLDRSRPLWEMHLIEGLADGRYAVYTKIHHALTDGVAGMQLLRRALSADPDAREMPAPWEPRATPPRPPAGPVAGNVTPFALPGTALRTARAAAAEVAGLAPALAGTLDRAVRAGGGPLTLTAPHSVLNVPIGGARSFAARSWPLERLKLVAKHADATINDVVLTMCGGALRTLLTGLGALPDSPLIAMVPVSLRGEHDGNSGNSSGNKIGTLMCPLGTDLPDPAHRLQAVRAGMGQGKAAMRSLSHTQNLAMSALGAAPIAVGMLLGRGGPIRPPNILISNVPGPDTPLYWNGARLDALYPLSIPVDGQALNIAATSTDDQIAFGLTGCRRAVPDLHPMLDHLDDELDALERAAGL
ncbi:wax ester/triacylglycerol synthase family O-acyltransferase [Rhodococcus sp. WS4]|nr:wax ester/triacylglycerol synthase family O-acyltransferase [Rhodococcus sp. WS4]